MELCSLVSNNLVKDSKVKDTSIQYSNKLINCYIENKESVINGELVRSIIRHGIVGSLAVLKDTAQIHKN